MRWRIRQVLPTSPVVKRTRVSLAFCLLLVSVLPVRSAAPRPPNVLFILVDDLGWADAGFAGSRFYETPHLDALAAAGVRFTSFYVSPTRVATRAALLSGQYPARENLGDPAPADDGVARVRRLEPPPFRGAPGKGLSLIAQLLSQAGYHTAVFGEWGMDLEAGLHPTQRGFAEALLTRGPHVGFTTEPPQEIPEGTYLTDFLTDRSLEYLERHRDHPFFLYLAHVAVGAPYQGKPEVVSRFAKKAPAGNHRDAVYAAMIASLDEGVGRLLQRLEDLKIADHTVVIFTSDGGGVGGYIDPESPNRRPTGVTDNAPLRGGNGMLYEGGIRVPFVIRWPGVNPPGSRTTQPAIHVDLFPTLCDIAGIRPPEGQVLDGVSLAALIRDPGGHLGRDAIFWHFPDYLRAASGAAWRTTPAGAVRAGNFKLIESYEDGRLELFNLVEDLGEKDNLVRSLPDKTEELKAKLAEWRTAVSAAMPTLPAPAAGARP